MDSGSDLHRHHGSGTESATAVDPICGMIVDSKTAKHQTIHQGQPYFFCCGGCKAKFEADPDRYLKKGGKDACCRSQTEAEDSAVIDPVCSMTVNPQTAKYRADYQGRTYYFCRPACKVKFQTEPKRYLEPKAPAAPVSEGAIYTCPMDPQIRQVGPGSCPICGMALEPEMPSAADEPNPELAYMSRRFWIGLVLALPVFAIEMGGHIFGLGHKIDPQTLNWVQFALATPVVLWCGRPFFERGWQSLKTRHFNMFTLIAMGTGVAWVYSVIATLFPGVFPAAFRTSEGAVPVYFEAAAVITVLVLLGQVLELRARAQTSGAIRALLNLAPKQARRIGANGTEQDVPLENVAAGDRLRVRPGESVPVDGEVVDGRSTVDESMVTGESMPVSKAPGAKVIGGTMNQGGSLVMRAEKVGRETMLAKIVQMVAEAQRSRAPIQRLADRVGGLVCASRDCGRRLPRSLRGRFGGRNRASPSGL